MCMQLKRHVEAVRSPFATESRFEVAQFRRGRLQLEAFKNSVHVENVELDPFGAGGLPPSQDQAELATSVYSTGINLRFHFGRDAQTGTNHPGSSLRF